MFRKISIKTQLILFLGCFAAYLAIRNKDAAFIFSILITTFIAVGIDAAFAYFAKKKLLLSESAVISGLIIGYVLSSDNPWWVAALASTGAICSKHFIRISRRHIFNPAAFGILLSVFLFGAATQWKGTYVWYIIVPFGLYFIYRIRRLELLAGYFLTSFVLFGVQALAQKTPLLNVFGYFSYFFVFVMLIEPKTTPIMPLGKAIFGIGVAIMVFVLTELGVKFDAELAALLALNPIVPLINNFTKKKGG